MRLSRLVVLPCLLLLAAPAGADARRATVKLTACDSAIEQAARNATFEGDMRAIRGTARMQMRFTLQARASRKTGWTRVSAPSFGAWLTSEPGRAGFIYAKTIENLLAPAQYRALVHFRWLDAGGEVIARDRRVSRACRQPDQRPDLRVLDVETRSGVDASTRRYGISLRNAGATAAGSFVVTLQPAGAEPFRQRVEELAAGERTIVWIEAPACAPGSDVQVTVDSTEEVDEAHEADDTVSFTCPA